MERTDAGDSQCCVGLSFVSASACVCSDCGGSILGVLSSCGGSYDLNAFAV